MKLTSRSAVRLVVAAGLAVDAFVHVHLASRYDLVKGSITQGNLFRIEAGVAVVAAVLVLLFDRWWAEALAVVVAGSDLAAILLYRFVNVGPLGPLPNMYEPIWFAEKVVAAVGVSVALGAAGTCLLMAISRPRASRSGGRSPQPVLSPSRSA